MNTDGGEECNILDEKSVADCMAAIKELGHSNF